MPSSQFIFAFSSLCCALSAAWVGAALAQSDVPASAHVIPASAPVIGAVRLEGIDTTRLEGIMASVESFIGRKADSTTLQQLAGAVAQEAKQRGYMFASVSVPQQSVRIGIVTVNFDPGFIDEVRVIGSKNQKVSTILRKLEGAPAQKKDVERQLLLVEDLAGITVKDSRYIKEGGRGILLVDVAEARVAGSLAADNWGSDNYGPIRLRATVDWNRVVSSGDTLSFSAVTTPLQPKELTFGSLQYATSVGTHGAQMGLAAAAGRTRPGSLLAGLDLKGHSHSASLFARTPLKRSADSSFWVSAQVERLEVDQKLLDRWLQEDVSTSLTLTLSGSHMLAEGRLNWGIGVVRGLEILGSSRSGDPMLSRADGSGVFTKQVLWFNWYRDMGGDVSVRLAATAQYASRGLLASHELGYGGAYFGRGYDFSEISGDDGVIGLIEVRRSVTLPSSSIKWAHIYGFVDGTWLDNKDTLIDAGSLFSAGAGVRAGAGALELGFEGAMPLRRAPYGEDNPKPRFNVFVGYGF